MRDVRRLLRDYALAIGGAVLFAMLVRTFVLGAYRVPSRVMSPALLPGDTIFVTKWPYIFASPLPHRGDVIIFQNPTEGGADFVRRVVGLPGDRVAIEDGKIRVNGVALAATTASPPCVVERMEERQVRVCWDPDRPAQMKEIAVPDGSIFVIGDHRSKLPGQTWKPLGELVNLKNIRGRVWVIWLSLDPPGERSWLSRIRFDRMFRSV